MSTVGALPAADVCNLKVSGGCGSVTARKRPLIQPFNAPLSTCTQLLSLFVTSKRVPICGLATTLLVDDAADLMFTPGRCRKRISGFCVTVADGGCCNASCWGASTCGGASTG